MAKRTNQLAWGLAATLVVVLLGGVGVALRYGVQVGNTRVHWHRVEGFYVGKLLVSGGGSFGTAYALGLGAICVYRQLVPETGADAHELFVEITPDLLYRASPPEGKRSAGEVMR